MNDREREMPPNRRPLPSRPDLLVTLAAVLCLGAGTVAGCAPAESGRMSAEQEQALADTLRALTEQVDAVWEQLEPEPYLTHYSDDAHFYYEGSGLPRKKFEAVVRKEMAAYEKFSTEMMSPQVEVLGPDAGVVSFRYRGEAVDTAGSTEQLTAAVTVVFERRNGEWKIVQAHESFPPPEE